MLPSGPPQDEIDGVPVTLIDVAMPMMVVRADSLGKTGYETPAELDADTSLFARVERMRRTAGELMGMGDVSGMVVPKVSLVAPPRSGHGVSSRYLVPNRTHQAHAATGAVCVASAAVAPGTVASEVARIDMASKPVRGRRRAPGRSARSLPRHPSCGRWHRSGLGRSRTHGAPHLRRQDLRPAQCDGAWADWRRSDRRVCGLTYRVPNRRRRQARHRFVNR